MIKLNNKVIYMAYEGTKLVRYTVFNRQQIKEYFGMTVSEYIEYLKEEAERFLKDHTGEFKQVNIINNISNKEIQLEV